MNRIRDQHKFGLIIALGLMLRSSSSWLDVELLSVKGVYNLPTNVTF